MEQRCIRMLDSAAKIGLEETGGKYTYSYTKPNTNPPPVWFLCVRKGGSNTLVNTCINTFYAKRA